MDAYSKAMTIDLEGIPSFRNPLSTFNGRAMCECWATLVVRHPVADALLTPRNHLASSPLAG